MKAVFYDTGGVVIAGCFGIVTDPIYLTEVSKFEEVAVRVRGISFIEDSDFYF